MPTAGLASGKSKRGPCRLRFGLPWRQEFARFAHESFGAFQQMTDDLSAAEREATRHEIPGESPQYEGPDELVGPREMIVGVR